MSTTVGAVDFPEEEENRRPLEEPTALTQRAP